MALKCGIALPPEQTWGGGKAELSVLSAVTELLSCVEFHFSNCRPFMIRPFVFVHLRAHVLPNNL